MIGITQGDETGIGPEIIERAVLSQGLSKYPILIIGNPKFFPSLKKKKISFIAPSSKFKNMSYGALKLASHLCLNKKISAIVTAPVNKHKITKDEGKTFLGHTEFLKYECERFFKRSFHPTMFFAAKKDYLALVTTHCPLTQVSQRLSLSLLKKTIFNVNFGLKKYFSIKNPNIALLGLNPHAGEAGLLGKEEMVLLTPAIKWAKAQSIHIQGPFSSDSFFSVHTSSFHCVIALYHDQGLIPFKLRHFHEAVNITLGLPIIRTSVDHGVGYDIAKKGIANPKSMINAIRIAVQMSKK